MKKRFYKSRVFWAAIVVLIGIAWGVQRPVLSEFAAFTAEVVCAQSGLDFHAESVTAGLFEPLKMDRVVVRVRNGGSRSQSLLELDSLVITWQDALSWFSNPKRAVGSIELTRPYVFLDFRREESGQVSELAKRPVELLAAISSLGGSWPQKIEIKNAAMEWMNDSTRFVIYGLKLAAAENEAGSFSMDSLSVQSSRVEKIFGPMAAKTVWDGTRFSLAGMDFLPGVMINEISCDLPMGGEPAVSFNGRLFGGSVRGDWFFQQGESGAIWDFAAIFSHVNLAEIPPLFGLPGKAQGVLAEGRFTYRGSPSQPADAEASLRVLTKDFRWNERGWESLEVSASMIHRQLFISNFDLRQKENKVSLNGEISIAEGWGKINEAPFLLNLRANIKELGSLANLTSPDIEEINGELEANGSLSGRPGNLDGFIGIKAKDISFRGAEIQQAGLEILFQKKTAEIVSCELNSNGDEIHAKGSIDISAPHAYRASLAGSVADLSTWLRPFPQLSGGVVSSGALKIDWKGDGSIQGHFGNFDASLSKLVTTYTPAGLTGHFAGTYSPENIHFAQAVLENEALRMQSRITLASTGLNFDDVQLNASGKTLLHGKAFLPLNPFSISAQTDWKSAILGSATYLEANTPDELSVEDLVKLTGQTLPIRGLLKMQLQAYGPANEIVGKLTLNARDLYSGKYPSSAPTDLKIVMNTSEGRASLDGEMSNPRMSPIQLSSSFPFALQKMGEGPLQWIPSDAEINVRLDFPRADLALLRPLIANLPDLSGELSGRLNITGSIANPKAEGSAEIRDASFKFGSLAAPAEFVTGQLQIENSSLKIKNLAGEMDPGRFELSGICDFPAPWKPAWNLILRGEKIPLANDNLDTLLLNGELRAEGNADSGSISGEWRFVDSSISRQIQIQPLLYATGADDLDCKSPAELIENFAPFSNWSINLKIGTTAPIRLTGQKFAGSISPDLLITGTVKNPVPVGAISMDGMAFRVGVGNLFCDEAEFYFLPDDPWDPFVLATGTGNFAGLPVKASAFGPLSQGKWYLRYAENNSLPPQSIPTLLRGEGCPLSLPSDLIGPSEFFLTATNQILPPRPVALRVEDQNLLSGGMRFQDSMDFSLHGSLLPSGSFEQGFEWNWSPAF